MASNHQRLTYKNISIDIVSENAVILTWPETINVKQHQHIIACQQEIQTQLQHSIIEILSSYNSIMVYYHFDKVSVNELFILLKKCLITVEHQQLPLNKSNIDTSKTIEIPVYYGIDAGWDLPLVSQQSKLTTNEIIDLHSGQTYRAYALGFTPGFCYLASLPNALQLARKANPRKKVPKGAVAIAEQQTAVYPNESPGGWHIIGQTPLPMYSIHNGAFKPRIQVGENIRFKAISQAEFLALGGVIAYE